MNGDRDIRLGRQFEVERIRHDHRAVRNHDGRSATKGQRAIGVGVNLAGADFHRARDVRGMQRQWGVAERIRKAHTDLAVHRSTPARAVGSSCR